MDCGCLCYSDSDAMGTDEMIADRYRAPALDKGLDILELLSKEPSGLTRSEIVRAMGRSQGEIYRMLERLVARDYVARLEGDRFELSIKLFVLATRYPPISRLIAAAAPQMAQFARLAVQSCHLAVYDGGDVIIVAQESSPGDWGLTLRLGARINLLETGSGRTLLAFQTEAHRARMMAEHRADSADRAADPALEPSLAEIRHRGHWRGPSRQALGVIDISVPILGPSDAAIAVLTCPYLKRLDDTLANGEQKTCQLLLQAAESLRVRSNV
jgi:DNA-binding IclR family transcriptional regulator